MSESFIGRTEVPSYFTLLVNEEPFNFQWDEFTQTPSCNYAIEYTLTIAEVENGNVSSFSQLTEGEVPPSIVTFNDINRELEYRIVSSEYIGKTFVCYLNAKLDVSEYQSAVVQLMPSWQFKVIQFPYIPPNRPPYIQGLFVAYDVESEKKTLVHIGTPIDPEGEGLQIKSWKIEQGSIPWIVLRQSMDDLDIISIDFEFNPPVEETGESFNLNIVLIESNGAYPFEIEVSVVINIISLQDSSYKVTLDEEYEPDTIYEAIVNEPSMYGEMVIEFNYDVILPEGIEEWTSQNIGAEYFELHYIPSEESEIFFDEADISIEIGWSIASIDGDSVTLQLNFTTPLAVSTSPYDIDQLTFNIKKPEEILVVGENRPIRWKQEPVSRNLVQQIGDQSTRSFLESTTATIQGTLATFLAANVLLSVVLSCALQFLWGLINGLQMIVLTVLFSVMRPMNAEVVLTTIMQFVNFDLDFGGTGELLNRVFKFSDSDPFTPIFEKAGYSGTTYLDELGIVFFFMLAFLVGMVILEILKLYLRKTTVSNRVTNYLTTQVKRVSYRVIIVRFLLEGCIELGLTAMICVLSMRKESETRRRFLEEAEAEVDSLLESQTSDWISNACAILTLIGMLASPFYLYHAAKKYFNNQEDTSIMKKFNKLFAGFSLESFSQLNYSLIFILRRCTMVLVLTLLPTQRNIQINIQLCSTLFVMSYTTYVLPFKSLLQNYQETFNEITVLLASYHLFCFTEWVYDLNARFSMGWSLLAVIAINVAVNIGITLYAVFKESTQKVKDAYYTRERKLIIQQNARIKDERKRNQFDFVIEARTRPNYFNQSQLIHRSGQESSGVISEAECQRIDVNKPKQRPPETMEEFLAGGVYEENNQQESGSSRQEDLGSIQIQIIKNQNNQNSLNIIEHEFNESINDLDELVVDSFYAPTRYQKSFLNTPSSMKEEEKTPKTYNSIFYRASQTNHENGKDNSTLRTPKTNYENGKDNNTLKPLQLSNPAARETVEQGIPVEHNCRQQQHQDSLILKSPEKRKSLFVNSAQSTLPLNYIDWLKQKQINHYSIPQQSGYTYGQHFSRNTTDKLYFNFSQEHQPTQPLWKTLSLNQEQRQGGQTTSTFPIHHQQPSHTKLESANQREDFSTEITSIVQNAFKDVNKNKRK